MTAIPALIAEWMPGQRWFAGKGRDITDVHDEAVTISPGDGADEPSVEVHLVRVEYSHGEPETYLVPLTLHTRPADNLGHALLGESDSRHWVYDATQDRQSTPVWMRLLTENADRGPLRFHLEPGAELPLDIPGDSITTEQSNTSLVFGEQVILKLFRRLDPGLNPDVEVHEALMSTGNTHVAALLGHVELVDEKSDGDSTVDQGASYTIAMAQSFLPSASDGWSLALTSVRDLLAEADLHPAEVGGDFGPEAHRLGEATAAVHADLARSLPTDTLDEAGLARLADDMDANLDAALDVVPQLEPHVPALRAAYSAVRGLSAPIPIQRVHGDLHLGQVLRTTTGWTLLDFEGEPARPLAHRRRLDTPLRDVASMLRSFDYASRHLLLDEPDDPQLSYRASEWAGRNQEAFCAGYADTAGFDPNSDATLLRALQADKAVYEAVYEARSRPRWLPIPLDALDRLSAEFSGEPR